MLMGISSLTKLVKSIFLQFFGLVHLALNQLTFVFLSYSEVSESLFLEGNEDKGCLAG